MNNKTNSSRKGNIHALLNKHQAPSSTNEQLGQVVDLALDLIDTDPTQPRQTFEEERLNELAASIKRNGGVEQPIKVMPNPNAKGRYIIKVGERRYRSSGIAGMSTIKAIIEPFVKDEGLLLLQRTIENTNNEVMCDYDVVQTVGKLIYEFNMKTEEVMEAISYSRSRVSEYVTIYKAPENLQALLKNGAALRPVVELCRLAKADVDFVNNQINGKSASDITLPFVDELKKAQVAAKELESGSQIENAQEEPSLSTESDDGETLYDQFGSNAADAATVDVNDKETSPDKKSKVKDKVEGSEGGADDQLLSTLSAAGDINIDISGAFKSRPASQAVLRVKIKNLVGTLAASYKPNEPHFLPLELDDGELIMAPITECTIIGYE